MFSLDQDYFCGKRAVKIELKKHSSTYVVQQQQDPKDNRMIVIQKPDKSIQLFHNQSCEKKKKFYCIKIYGRVLKKMGEFHVPMVESILHFT